MKIDLIIWFNLGINYTPRYNTIAYIGWNSLPPLKGLSSSYHPSMKYQELSLRTKSI